MPLSNIFSASTSSALYWTKTVLENISATQPMKETVARDVKALEEQRSRRSRCRWTTTKTIGMEGDGTQVNDNKEEDEDEKVDNDEAKIKRC